MIAFDLPTTARRSALDAVYARDLLNGDSASIHENATDKDAESLSNDQRISVAAVVDTQRRLVGVITQADLARHEHQNSGPVSDGESSERGVVKASQDGKVRDAMSQPAYVFAPDALAASVADVILSEKSDRVFLVSDGVFIGAIKAVDVLRRLMIGQSPYDQVKRMR